VWSTRSVKLRLAIRRSVVSNLYTRLFRRVGFPLLDRLNGTRITGLLGELEAAERLPLPEIRRRQARDVERTVSEARRRSGFYPAFWAARRDRGIPSEHPALDGLPVVTKEDLLAGASNFPEPSFRGRVIACRTSGSTGAPMTFYRSAAQESWFWALRFRIWGWGGYRPGDPYLTINLNRRDEWRKRLQDVFFRCTYLTFNSENQDSGVIVEALRRKRIPFLNGFSSSLFVLARYVLEHQLEVPSIRSITSTGDGLFPHYRETIERAFGVRVLDYYGAGGEGLHLASQCPESGARYHLHPENACVELLGPDGPVAQGEPGRVVVTQLCNDAMPLIRYELGDVAVAAPDSARCSCGRTLPMLERVEGRVPDLIAVAGGTFLVPHFFVVVFKNLQDVHRYQIVQEEITSITARLVARDGCDRGAVEAAVRREVAAATGGALTVVFDWVEEIPLSGAGKRRLVSSSVAPLLLGVPAREESRATSVQDPSKGPGASE
jgi:phenylacetate-CoA ligase